MSKNRAHINLQMALSGAALFQKAEICYHMGDTKGAFDYYIKSIKKILKDEDVIAKFPTFPTETMVLVWRNFCGFYRDPKINFTEATSSEGWKLLNSFRPLAIKGHERFDGPRAQILLKAMQITAGLTLGLLAWDKKDRATAAKRYKEAIDLAATHPPFYSNAPNKNDIESWVAYDVVESKENLRILMQNDEYNAEVLKFLGLGGGNLRRQVINLGNSRVEGDGYVNLQHTVAVATDSCNKCNKRDVKLSRCGKCKKVAYCGSECQRADWKAHKPLCSAAE